MATKKINKALTSMLDKIKEAKKQKLKSVVVYTTKRSDHKAKIASGQGFGFNDLKPSLQEAYKHLVAKFDLNVSLLDINDFSVEWKVVIK